MGGGNSALREYELRNTVEKYRCTEIHWCKKQVGGGDTALREYEARLGKNLERGGEYEQCDSFEEPEAC